MASKNKLASVTAARTVLGLLAAAVVGIFAAVNYHSDSKLHELRQNGVKTVGAVSGRNCSNHGQIYYSFYLNGKEHQGWGTSCVQSCSKAEIGGPVEIIYSQNEPENHRCGSLEETGSSDYVFLMFLSIVLAFAIYRITEIE